MPVSHTAIVASLHKCLEAILGAIPKTQGSGSGLGQDCNQKPQHLFYSQGATGTYGGFEGRVENSWYHQILHVVLLFSAAKMIPSCRPTASGLQIIIYRHERDNDK